MPLPDHPAHEIRRLPLPRIEAALLELGGHIQTGSSHRGFDSDRWQGKSPFLFQQARRIATMVLLQQQLPGIHAAAISAPWSYPGMVITPRP